MLSAPHAIMATNLWITTHTTKSPPKLLRPALPVAKTKAAQSSPEHSAAEEGPPLAGGEATQAEAVAGRIA